MRKFTLLAVVLIVVVTGLVFGAGRTEVTTRELSFAHVYEPDLAYHREAVWAAQEIERRTDGRFTVQVYPASQLGSESEIAEGLGLGTVDMIYAGAAFLSGSYGPIAIAEAPFIYRDFDHWLAFADSDLMGDLAAGYREATGHHIISPTYYGARHITSNKPIRTPADMRGLTIRVPDAPLYLLFPRAVGASPTPVAFAEVYLALQQGVVEAQENPLPTIRGMAFFEVQDYINLTGHMVNTLMTIVRGDLWEELSAADRAIFDEVFSEAAIRSSQAIYQEEQELGEWFEAQGLTVLEVDRRPFMDIVEPLLSGPQVPWTEEHLQRMQAIR
ncbi:MAG: DctP family TRAP transporter solute-binding subunit [Spirochaetaceae bacterium]|nr:MAG: DctP family TRAP transporter solute-binding subunit [Spirochaetaceae bacterium]